MADIASNQLLQDYAEHGSEHAFAVLVERHLGLVYGTALGQVHEPHLAEDVAQAVFTLLGRKAKSLRRGIVLSGWLYRTTRFVAAGLEDVCRRALLVDAAGGIQHGGLQVLNLMDRMPYWREGQLRFELVPRGTYVLELRAAPTEAPSHQTPVTVEPGVSPKVHIGPLDPDVL